MIFNQTPPVSGGMRVTTGSYVGTGNYGPEHKNRLEFTDITPSLVVITNPNGFPTVFIRDSSLGATSRENYYRGGFVRVIWEERAVSWYFSEDEFTYPSWNGDTRSSAADASFRPDFQLNAEKTYHYLVIGAECKEG